MLLFRSLRQSTPDFASYRTRLVDGRTPVKIGSQTVDGCLWIALVLPKPPRDDAERGGTPGAAAM